MGWLLEIQIINRRVVYEKFRELTIMKNNILTSLNLSP